MAQDLSPTVASGVIPSNALAHIPGCEAGMRPDAVTALPGGSVNRSFRVDTRAGTFVLRLNDAAGAVLGAHHGRELRLHGAAALAGVAPELIFGDLAERFMITRHVAGAAWVEADFARPERLRRLGATLRTLHTVAAPAVVPFDPAAIMRGHAAILIEAQPAERALVEELMEQADAALALCARSARAPTIVHNDLHHSNLIDAERLYLIDWEYAAVADPIFDPACVLAYYPQAEPYAPELLDAVGLAAEVSVAELARARFVFLLLSFLWYRRRRLNGAVAAADRAAEDALLRRLRA
ncbi:MAG TPA: phosphotransferase [Steroidobacteraceae bacterium]|jgi:thiamine kinase|nr:phosphotransferase [Steroidobacteraceae bacterium]